MYMMGETLSEWEKKTSREGDKVGDDFGFGWKLKNESKKVSRSTIARDS